MAYKASIIIPVYNEKKYLSSLCEKLNKSFKDYNIKYIFVDDGSNDGSSKWLLDNLNLIFYKNNYELINIQKNIGKGNAIKQGLKKTEGDYTLFIDSDLEYQPSDLLEMYKLIVNNQNVEVLYGSRNLGGRIQLRRYLLNSIAVKINTFIFNFLFNQSITDLHTGTKIIKNTLLKKINLTTNGFGLEIDLSSQISKLGINIYEYSISYFERSLEEGKKITFVDGFLSYYFLLRARFFQNNLSTSISLIFSLLIMIYFGNHFGAGFDKVFFTLIFIIVGLMIALNRGIIHLSFIYLLTYIGFANFSDNYNIYSLIIYFILSLYITTIIKKKI